MYNNQKFQRIKAFIFEGKVIYLNDLVKVYLRSYKMLNGKETPKSVEGRVSEIRDDSIIIDLSETKFSSIYICNDERIKNIEILKSAHYYKQFITTNSEVNRELY